MKTFHVVCVLLAMIGVGGCAQKEMTTATEGKPLTGVYTLTQIDGEAVTVSPPIQVTFENNRLFGNGPVNRWNTTVQEGGALGIVISTRMAGPPERMELEYRLLQALEGSSLKAGADGGLAITKEGRKVVLLEPMDSNDANGAAGAASDSATH